MSGHRIRRLWLVLAALSVAAVSACKKEARSMTGAEGGAVTLAPIDVTAFPQDPAVAVRILRMPFDEAAQRLGSLSFEARTFFVFNRGGEEHEQTHVGKLTQDSTGNFHVVADTGPSQVELYLIGESVYVRQDKGHLRKKPRREANTDTWREVVWSSSQQALGLFAPQLRFIEPRPDTAAGRQAVRYRVALAQEGEEGIILTPSARSLPVAPTSRWRELARPLAATGSVWIDSETGTILKVKLEGRLEVADRDVRPTQLSIRHDAAVSKPGAVAPLSAPESVPEHERTPPPGDPISFFRADLEKAAAAAGEGAGAGPQSSPPPTGAPPAKQPKR
jgi:hypothetical protein